MMRSAFGRVSKNKVPVALAIQILCNRNPRNRTVFIIEFIILD